MAAPTNGLVRHLLLARIREGTSPDVYEAAMAAFREMAHKVEGVVGFEYGANNSPEGQNHGLTHVVLMTFASPEARDAYLPHAEHLKFADWIGQQDIIEEMLVFDYHPLS